MSKSEFWGHIGLVGSMTFAGLIVIWLMFYPAMMPSPNAELRWGLVNQNLAEMSDWVIGAGMLAMLAMLAGVITRLEIASIGMAFVLLGVIMHYGVPWLGG